MDLERPPEARFPHSEVVLSPKEVEDGDINYVVSRISPFGDDNRAGIERTLHRISAIRNRKGKIVGLTCRVGRAVFGTIRTIDDLVRSGKSILLLGRPGVGKTTMLREVARVLADDVKKRVVIVDTSNEIAGDGDIPHPAIGHARRMQVTTPTLQHAVMIEAVENHMPEVIIIDEIGTELEAMAARTIAERGVQLVATAHGNTLENLVLNPTLSDLIGGIQSVTLGDEEARRRRTKKSILERKSPPTFQVVVEIQNWERVGVHPDVAETVDALLRGSPIVPEVRFIDEEGKVRFTRESQTYETPPTPSPSTTHPSSEFREEPTGTKKVYPFGVSKSLLEQTIRNRHLPIQVVNDLRGADVLLTTKSYFRRRAQTIRSAEATNVPVFVLRKNTFQQIEECLATIAPSEVGSGSYGSAMQEAKLASEKVLAGEDVVELSPQNSFIRRLQHQLAERLNINSQSWGREPFRRVRFFQRGNSFQG